MKTYPVYLWPLGALASRLGSDTLFGAVCWGIRLLELADVGAMLDTFNAVPRFAFSGLFPAMQVEKDQYLRFYPHPLLPPLALQSSSAQKDMRSQVRAIEKAKLLKQKAYLSEVLFTEVIQGEADHATFLERFRRKGGVMTSDIEPVGQGLISYPERRALQRRGTLASISRETDIQHNHVDRVAGATVEGLLFTEQETFFRARGGLWCALRTDEETLDTLVAPALRYLADTGLGANRTSGKGQFDIEVREPLDLPQAADPNCFVTLSRYLPCPGEWSPDARPLHYTLLNLWPKREKKFARTEPGQKTPPIYKRRLRMFAPGSIFPLSKQQALYGQLVEAVPAASAGHTIWQSGLAVPVFARIRQKKGETVA